MVSTPDCCSRTFVQKHADLRSCSAVSPARRVTTEFVGQSQRPAQNRSRIPSEHYFCWPISVFFHSRRVRPFAFLLRSKSVAEKQKCAMNWHSVCVCFKAIAREALGSFVLQFGAGLSERARRFVSVFHIFGTLASCERFVSIPTHPNRSKAYGSKHAHGLRRPYPPNRRMSSV